MRNEEGDYANSFSILFVCRYFLYASNRFSYDHLAIRPLFRWRSASRLLLLLASMLSEAKSGDSDAGDVELSSEPCKNANAG